MTRTIPIWAEVAAADRFSIGERNALAQRFAAEAGAPGGSGIATILTCHRVERYRADDSANAAGADVDARMAPPAEDGLPSPTRLEGDAAVRHLIRLAVGLESAVLGEDQVLHQVRLALADVCARHADPRLIRLFELAVGAGRRARAEHPAADRNLGELAVRWLELRAGLLRGRPVVVAGSGPMGRVVAAAFARRGAEITVASRTIEHAQAVAVRFGGHAADLAAGAQAGLAAAGVVVALGGPWTDFSPGADLPVVDLSFPGAIPATARAGLNGSLADVDRIFREAGSLQPDGAAGRDFRAGAEGIVDEAVAAYDSWLAGRPSVATLRTIRERADERRRTELQRLLRRLPELEPRERELVEAFSERLVAGLLHGPSVALRDDADGTAAVAATRLFRL